MEVFCLSHSHMNYVVLCENEKDKTPLSGITAPARGVGKWKRGWESRREGGRVLAIENFNLFNYTCYDLHAMIIYYVYYIYYNNIILINIMSCVRVPSSNIRTKALLC